MGGDRCSTGPEHGEEAEIQEGNHPCVAAVNFPRTPRQGRLRRSATTGQQVLLFVRYMDTLLYYWRTRRRMLGSCGRFAFFTYGVATGGVVAFSTGVGTGIEAALHSARFLGKNVLGMALYYNVYIPEHA